MDIYQEAETWSEEDNSDGQDTAQNSADEHINIDKITGHNTAAAVLGTENGEYLDQPLEDDGLDQGGIHTSHDLTQEDETKESDELQQLPVEVQSHEVVSLL